jgi:PAS domain S-box-containing protein
MNSGRKTVLVVDDVPDDIVILEEILKEEYNVKAVTSGEAAIQLARGESPPDMILLDVMMPGMDGFEVCRQLKQDARGATIPVVFLTAKVATNDEKLGFELGAVDYVRKPIEPEIVLQRVKAHLEQKDQAIRISEVKYRRLFETARDGIMIVDTKTEAVLDVNPALAAIMGTTQEAFLGRRAADFAFLRTIMAQQRGLGESERRSYVRYRDLPLETFDGRKIYVEFVGSAYSVNGREVMQLNVREITDLVETERERDELDSRLSHYLATSPTITYSMAPASGKAEWLWVSENVEDILGYSVGEALAPDWWFANVNPADRSGVIGIVSDLVKRGVASREYRFLKKDRSAVWLHDEMRYLAGSGSKAEIVGTLTDISERKRAEEEILLKSAALEATAAAVVISDRDGVIKWANPAFSILTGFSVSEAIGKEPGILVGSGAQNVDFYRRMWNTINLGQTWKGLLVNRRKSGELYTEEMTITPVKDEAGRVSSFVAVKNDVTEKERSRERLEAALDEKEALLREIHHRVNNNMQIIISLLNISSQDIADDALREKLETITRRIHWISIIHEQFYQSKDMARIDFAVYLRQLVKRAMHEAQWAIGDISLDCRDGEVLLHLEQAIPAGLIVAELLTNAIKYAYPVGLGQGAIRIAQRCVGGTAIEVEVADEGVGLPPDLVPATAESIGMILIRLLSEQLRGNVSFKVEKGTKAVVSFPLETVAGSTQHRPGGLS